MKKVAIFLGLSGFLLNIQCDLFSGMMIKNYLPAAEGSKEVDLSKYFNGNLLLAKAVIKANYDMATDLNTKAQTAKAKIQTNNYDSSKYPDVLAKAQAVLASVTEVERQFALIKGHYDAINQPSGLTDREALRLKDETEKAMEELIKQASIAEVNATVVVAVADAATAAASAVASTNSALQAVKDATFAAKNSADAAVASAQAAVTQAVLNLKSSPDAAIAAAVTAAETALNAAKAEQAKAVAANNLAQAATDITVATAQKTAAQTAANIAQSQAITASSKAKEALTLSSMGNISSDRQAISQAVSAVAGKAAAIAAKAATSSTQDPNYLTIMASSSHQAIKNFARSQAGGLYDYVKEAADAAKKAEDDLKKAQTEANASGMTTAQVAVKKALAEYLKQVILDEEKKVANGGNLVVPFSDYCAVKGDCAVTANFRERRLYSATSSVTLIFSRTNDSQFKVYNAAIVFNTPAINYNKTAFYLSIAGYASQFGGAKEVYVLTISSSYGSVFIDDLGNVYK